MSKIDIPINYKEEPIEINEVWYDNEVVDPNNKFELWFTKYIIALAIAIIIYFLWFYNWKTWIDIKVWEMQGIYKEIQLNNKMIINLISKNKVLNTEFDLKKDEVITLFNKTVSWTWNIN